MWAAVILLLCVADAVLTVGHVSRGARELNPLMAYLLAEGTIPFLTVKLALSSFALAALAAFLPRYRYARTCFGTLGAIYGAVLCYHVSFFLF